MKLLLFSDLHCDTKAAQQLVERAANADVLIGAGDFANIRLGINHCIEILRTVNRPAVLVPGNNESFEELRTACRDWSHAHVLHGTSVVINGLAFFGIGGGIPVTPFGSWSFDFTEEEATSLLAPCPAGCVLVSHSPPKGAVDISSRGRSLGSTAVLGAITQKKPVLVVCGHIHESGGQVASIADTPVVNAGPRGIDWQLQESGAP